MQKSKLETLADFGKLSPEQTKSVFGGSCTSQYTNTSVPTNGSTDTATNPNDWSGFKDDGGGCPPNDTTTIKTTPTTTDSTSSIGVKP